MIGRDLVRLLQNVARIPEFELLWKDIIHNPQALSPQFTGEYGLGPAVQERWEVSMYVLLESRGQSFVCRRGFGSQIEEAWDQAGSAKCSWIRERQSFRTIHMVPR